MFLLLTWIAVLNSEANWVVRLKQAEAMRRAQEALPFYQEALALLEPLADRAPLTLSRTLHESAIALAKAGHRDTSLAQFQRALTLATNYLAPSHRFLATLHRDYAQLLRQLHRRREAKQEENVAKAIWEKHAKENLLGHTVDVRSFR